MKALIRITPILFLSFLILVSCNKSEESATKEAPKTTVLPPPPTPLLIGGNVKSMRTKQGIANVAIKIDGKSQNPTNGNGSFPISYTPNTTITISYSHNNYETLTQEYTNMSDVNAITVYLEEASSPSVNNKSVRGIIEKEAKGSNSVTPLKDIQIGVASNGRTVTTKTNKDGFYSIPFTGATPVYTYDYKINATTKNTIITQRSSIKDSSDVDIIFDEAVGGIQVDTLEQ